VQDERTAVNNQPTERLAYRPAEAAHALSVSRTTIYKWMEDGVLTSVTAGRARLIPAAELRDFLERPRRDEEPS
jgi:excisionase family DNA binding protein